MSTLIGGMMLESGCPLPPFPDAVGGTEDFPSWVVRLPCLLANTFGGGSPTVGEPGGEETFLASVVLVLREGGDSGDEGTVSSACGEIAFFVLTLGVPATGVSPSIGDASSALPRALECKAANDSGD